MTKRAMLCVFLVLTCTFSFLRDTAQAQNGQTPELIKKYWGADDSQALRVARCESNYDPHARNGSHYGVFQLSRKYHEARARNLGYSWDDMWDAGKNTRVAYDLYKDSEWGPWVCKP